MKKKKTPKLPVEDTTKKYQPPKYYKNVIVEQAVKHGYPCILKDGVVLFSEKDSEKRTEITDWLRDTYGKERRTYHKNSMEVFIPFSFGFGDFTKETRQSK